ncbi:MAG: amidohydrolase [Spirochaetaceae bacterium]|nr:amidohydrolase [Myxococcales bacterium]MCB9722459.1 amidohydrolase [Spirochaetaceae bacterium]
MAAAPDLTTDSLFDRCKPIDVDTHITEPPDVWTSRVSKKWGDKVPHIVQRDGRDLWMIGDQMAGGPGFTTAAGFDGSYPEFRNGYHDIPKSSWDAKARLEYMDEEGIWGAVLYPNVGGFGSGGFLKLGEPELMLECVRAYNDFLVDWCSAAPDRLIPVAAMPFWDVNECVKEVQRAASIGHKSILACSEPQAFGEPRLADRHWDPFWAAVQETGLPISFHIGAGDLSDIVSDPCKLGPKAAFSRVSSTIFMQNMNCIADLIFGGVCHRYPKLELVSVESGVGWIPSFLEACDWQFTNAQVRRDHPEFDLLPSEYFKRQIYACFWFEDGALQGAMDLIPDNLLWETDFPHPTCQHPGPANGFSQHPRDYVNGVMADVAEDTAKKILHSTAARLYGLE